MRQTVAICGTLLTAALVLTGCAKKDEYTILTGLVDATELDVASIVPGRIKALYVGEGETITAGQKLALIESEPVDAKLEQISQGIKAAEAMLKMAKKGARPEEKDIVKDLKKSAQYQVDIAKKMYDRTEELFKRGSVPQATLDEALFAYNIAKEQLGMAESRERMVHNGTRIEEIESLQAVVNQAKAVKTEIESFKKDTLLTAPIAGEVYKEILHKGELAVTGYPIVTIIDKNDSWISFSLREDLLAGRKIGDTVTVEIPALGRKVDCRISYIAGMGDFAVWKATSEKNSFDLRSFELKIRPIEKVPELLPGMTARWTIKGR